MSFLKNLDGRARANDGATVIIKDPMTGKAGEYNGKPIKIYVVGLKSDAFRKYQEAKAEAERNGEAEWKGEKLLAALTTGWDNMPDVADPDQKKTVKFSTETAEKSYFDLSEIADQVDEVIAEKKSFMMA